MISNLQEFRDDLLGRVQRHGHNEYAEVNLGALLELVETVIELRRIVYRMTGRDAPEKEDGS